MDPLNDATGVLLANLSVRRLNELAADGDFELQVDGDEIAALRRGGVA